MTGFGVSVRSKGPVGVGGKLFLSLVFLIFFGAGTLFVWLVARDSLRGLQTWRWIPTQCEIISSGVRETEEQGHRTGDFYLEVRYRYVANGQTFTSDKRHRNPQSFSDYGKANRLSQRYPAESKATCYYNPAVPNEAILERSSLFAPLLILFPMIFVGIGAGGIYFTWRRKREVGETQKAISSRTVEFKSGKLVILFFLIFLLMGLSFLYVIFFRPLFKIVSARHWPAVSCVVISSEVKSHSGDKGATYSVNIFYSYEFDGREFKANAYDFVGGSSSGYDGKQAVVNQHPAGSKTVCYVNPKDPTEAVLDRGFSLIMLFGLIPLVLS